tara:strand:+ start:10040 stop:10234 length:195 start_codon:yes stop_codon:yes gene_type:complete
MYLDETILQTRTVARLIEFIDELVELNEDDATDNHNAMSRYIDIKRQFTNANKVDGRGKRCISV